MWWFLIFLSLKTSSKNFKNPLKYNQFCFCKKFPDFISIELKWNEQNHRTLKIFGLLKSIRLPLICLILSHFGIITMFLVYLNVKSQSLATGLDNSFVIHIYSTNEIDRDWQNIYFVIKSLNLVVKNIQRYLLAIPDC